MRLERLERIAGTVVRDVLNQLPTDLREAAQACKIEFDTMAAALEEDRLDTGLLGLFEGASRIDPPPQSAEELPCIRLFVDNLWDYADRNVQAFRREVRTTLLHELAHYLGFDEDEVAARGLA